MSVIQKLLSNSWQGIQKLSPSAQGRLRPSALGFQRRAYLSLEQVESRIQPSATVSLGAASNFAVLGLANTQINNSNVTITGNEGVSQGGKLTNMAASTINGNVEEYATGQYSGAGKLSGTFSVNPTDVTQADSDALSASQAAAALAPTQTFGGINTPTTVTGNGGLNVIAVNGSINSSLTICGTAQDVFIVNVTGSVNLTGSTALGLGGFVPASNVLYNFIGSSGTIATKVGNVLNGTLLAPTYSFNLDGVFNGEIIGGGKSIVLLSGAKVNYQPFVGVNPVSNTASLSGYVFSDNNGTGVFGSGNGGVPVMTVTLTGTDANGNSVSMQTMTDATGFYTFTGLTAGTYTLTVTPSGSFVNGQATPGTVNGNTDGVSPQFGVISSINLNTGDQGSNYNFAEEMPS